MKSFPSTYPNRAIRRAVCLNKPSRIPSEWKAFFATKNGAVLAEMIHKVGL